MVFGIDGFVDANDSGDKSGEGQDVRGITLRAGMVIKDIEAQRDDCLVLT